ncbi:MAG TPA: universal stress protein [Methylomirabilota bacterium]|nr:universal stress protein [Methylomirabilota bacterium]
MAKRILVAVDPSAQPEGLVDLVADAARGGGAIVRLLTVAPVPTNAVSRDGRVVAFVDQEMARIEANYLADLRVLKAHLEGVPVETAVRFGETAAEILKEAYAFHADLIALSTSRSVFQHLLGSVSETVARQSLVPVLLLRPPR